MRGRSFQGLAHVDHSFSAALGSIQMNTRHPRKSRPDRPEALDRPTTKNTHDLMLRASQKWQGRKKKEKKGLDP
jgi:hypothetical protein